MKKSVLVLPVTLTVLLGLWLLAMICLRTLLPGHILPHLDIPAVALLCLGALLAEHYLAPEAEHSYLLLAVLGALHFGLLPFAAGFALWQRALALALTGALALPLTSTAFTCACRRGGDRAPLGPWVFALGWFLAVQALRGVWI